MTLIPSVFAGDYPEQAVSWTLEAYDPMMPLRGTLVLLGESDIEVGDALTVDSEEYVVTAVTTDTKGTSVTTTITCRDHLYDLLVATSGVSITWITAPERLLKQETLANIELPVLTELRTRKGDSFGIGGWKMSEIIQEAAEAADLEVDYHLPDFWVKQITLDRFQPVLEFIQSALNSFFPRIYIEGGRIIIKPYANENQASVSTTGSEAVSDATVYSEPFSTLRIWGGTSEFQRDKWEGKELLDASPDTLNITMNTLVGEVTTMSQCGIRNYYSKIEDTHSMSLIREIFSLDMFGNDAFRLYREETKFTRKVPLRINDLAALTEIVNTMQNRITSDEPFPDPSQSDYYLDSQEKVLEVYDAYDEKWEQPVSIATHRSIARYLWWANTDDVPEGDEAPYGFPSRILPSRYGIGDDDVVGLWSQDAFYEVMTNTYEYDSSDEVGIVGGLLLNRSTFAFGIGRAIWPNLIDLAPNSDEPDYALSNEPMMYAPAYLNEEIDPIAYNPDVVSMKIASEIENYTEVSLRTVMKSRTKTFINPEQLTWFDDKAELGLAEDDLGYTQYKVESESALIPMSEAPQVISRMRGMLCYKTYSGSGKRVVEVSVPLIVSWDDMELIAEVVKQIHSAVKSIHTRSVTIPGYLPITGAMLGGSYGNAKVIGGTYTALGTGEHYSTLVTQEMV